MNIGDRVTVVTGLAPDGITVGTVVALDRHRVGVRKDTTTPPGFLWYPTGWVDVGNLHVHPHRHRATDPETARLAAAAAEERLTEHQWAVLTALVNAGRTGLIDHDHEARNGLIQTSAGKRRKELEHLGLCAPLPGTKRQTAQHRWAQVHAVTARGQAVYQHHQHTGAA